MKRKFNKGKIKKDALKTRLSLRIAINLLKNLLTRQRDFGSRRISWYFGKKGNLSFYRHFKWKTLLLFRIFRVFLFILNLKIYFNKIKFTPLNIENNEENRRAYREILFTTPEIENYISGVILFDETTR